MATLALEVPHCCRSCLHRLALQTRSITTSPARQTHGPVPPITPTPSPDLNALLTTFRTNVFFPSHLITLQRDLLYKRRNHALLTAEEPATVRLGAEVLQLKPLDRTKDEPPTRASFAKVVELMGECGDWRNLPSWLEGLKVARRRVKGWQVEKMVRRANEKGMMGVVMDCVRRVEKTGVVLGNVRVAREVAWGAVLKAVQSGWSEQGVESGVKYVENVWEMLCDGRHKGVEDPKKRPEVVGVLMQMYAAKALLIQGGRDEGGTVEKWAGLMLRLWENAELTVDETDWSDANYKLLMWSPVWHGIKMARQVLGSESPLSKRLEIRLTQDLEPLLQKTQAILDAHAPQEGKRRGLKMYESLSQVPT